MHSERIKRGPERAPARAMLRATGRDDEALARPFVGVFHAYSDVSPCNLNHRLLAEAARRGIEAAGGTAFEFGTIAVTDGIAMGTPGMFASLVSRETIADSIELAALGHGLDGLLAIVGCDKTLPAAAMALARLDRPGLVLYGGSIAAGRHRGREITIQEVFEAVGALAAGRIERAGARGHRARRLPRRRRLRRDSSPPTPWPSRSPSSASRRWRRARSRRRIRGSRRRPSVRARW
ncbi:MAG: dihydroxy-acid dehydratase [Xanthomonadales bacterium]|nr:dihydroxy-acid dehydratase [Xanthomonadales bacterium]